MVQVWSQSEKRVIIYFPSRTKTLQNTLSKNNWVIKYFNVAENKEKVEVNCIKLVYAVICRGRKG